MNSVGYFVTDSALEFVKGGGKPEDLKFLLHHVAILIGLAITVHYGVNGTYVVAMVFWGEVSNPVQSAYLVVSKLCAPRLDATVRWRQPTACAPGTSTRSQSRPPSPRRAARSARRGS